MSKKVQASDGLVKSAKVKADASKKPAQKPKPKAVDKTKAADKPQKAAKPEKSEKSKKAADGSTKKSGTAAKPARPENEAETSTKKGKAAAKTAQSEKVADGSTKKSKAAARPEKDEVQNDDLHEQRKPVKTPQVMKLVENPDGVNPVLLAGKSRVPPQLRKKQSLTSLMRREMGEVFYDVEDTVVVNITELAIEHEAPEILDRFNACSCDKCVEIFSRIISGRVPARFARVRKGGVETGSRELSERVAPMRKAVITEMIKELIVSKKRCYHDDTKGHL